MRIRQGNDFIFLWAIERDGLPEDFSNAENIKLHFKNFDCVGEVESFQIVDGNIVRVEVSPEWASRLGAYRLILSYEFEDSSYSDGDRKCVVDVLAFNIVPKTSEADDVTEMAKTTDIMIGLKGDPFTYDDFTPEQIEELQQPAKDATEFAQIQGEFAQTQGNFAKSEAERIRDLEVLAMTVRKTYQTEALALADKNPIDPTTSLPLTVGQFISIVDDGEKNGIYRIASISGNGTMSLELQGKLGDLSSYALKGGSTKTLKEVEDSIANLGDTYINRNIFDSDLQGIPATNIFRNGSFENSTDGKTADNWKLPNGVIKSISEDSVVGDKSQKAVVNWGDSALLYQDNQLPENTTATYYYVSVWVKTSVEREFIVSGFAATGQSIIQTVPANTWTRLRRIVKAAIGTRAQGRQTVNTREIQVGDEFQYDGFLALNLTEILGVDVVPELETVEQMISAHYPEFYFDGVGVLKDLNAVNENKILGSIDGNVDAYTPTQLGITNSGLPVPPTGGEITVKDFGAKGDGVTDDTLAFESAVAALPSAGGTVRIPDGIYPIRLTLSKSNLTFLGNGTNSILKHTDGAVATDYLINSNKKDNITLRGLNIKGSVKLFDARNAKVHDCLFDATGYNYGLYLRGNWMEISRCVFENAIKSGLYEEQANNNGVRITDNTFRDNGEDGCSMIWTNWLESGDTAIGQIVSNNTFGNNGHYGLRMVGLHDGVVSGNFIEANKYGGIRLENPIETLITGNFFEYNRNSAHHINPGLGYSGAIAVVLGESTNTTESFAIIANMNHADVALCSIIQEDNAPPSWGVIASNYAMGTVANISNYTSNMNLSIIGNTNRGGVGDQSKGNFVNITSDGTIQDGSGVQIKNNVAVATAFLRAMKVSNLIIENNTTFDCINLFDVNLANNMYLKNNTFINTPLDDYFVRTAPTDYVAIGNIGLDDTVDDTLLNGNIEIGGVTYEVFNGVIGLPV